MRQIEVLRFGHQSNPPLLHRDAPKQDLDRLAGVIHANTVDYDGFRMKYLSGDLTDQYGRQRRCLRLAAKPCIHWPRKIRGRQAGGDIGHHVCVSGPGIKEGPTVPPLHVDHLAYSAHEKSSAADRSSISAYRVVKCLVKKIADDVQYTVARPVGWAEHRRVRPANSGGTRLCSAHLLLPPLFLRRAGPRVKGKQVPEIVASAGQVIAMGQPRDVRGRGTP